MLLLVLPLMTNVNGDNNAGVRTLTILTIA